MVFLFPFNPDCSRFGNKYKSLLASLGTGCKVYCNFLQGFDELLTADTFKPYEDFKDILVSEYTVRCWRLPVPKCMNDLLNESMTDRFPERFFTENTIFKDFYSEDKIIDCKYHKIPRPIRDFYLSIQERVPWTPFMKEQFAGIPEMRKTLGVSVRTWKAPHDTGGFAPEFSQDFRIEDYKNYIERLSSKIESIYFSFDTPEAEKLVEDIQIPRKTIDRPEGITDLQWAALKSYALGQCGFLIGHRYSTFIEVAWWMGGCKAGVFLVG